MWTCLCICEVKAIRKPCHLACAAYGYTKYIRKYVFVYQLKQYLLTDTIFFRWLPLAFFSVNCFYVRLNHSFFRFSLFFFNFKASCVSISKCIVWNVDGISHFTICTAHLGTFGIMTQWRTHVPLIYLYK